MFSKVLIFPSVWVLVFVVELYRYESLEEHRIKNIIIIKYKYINIVYSIDILINTYICTITSAF